jgi:hypothetical protein
VFTLAATGNTFALFFDNETAGGDVNAGVFQTNTPTPTATLTGTATPQGIPSATPTPVGPPCAPVRDANLSFQPDEIEREGDGPFDATLTLRNTGSHAAALGVVLALSVTDGAKYIDRVTLPGGADWYVSGGSGSTTLPISDIAPGGSLTLAFEVYMKAKWLSSDDPEAVIRLSIASAACTLRGGARDSASIELERDREHDDEDDHRGGHDDDDGHDDDAQRLDGDVLVDATATGTATATPSATPTPAGGLADEPTVTPTPVPAGGAEGH